jgi:hypothetical protein
LDYAEGLKIDPRRRPEFALIIPVCDEAACIGPVLDEFLSFVDPDRFVIAVGVNGSMDASADIARKRPVLVAETNLPGYGHGCMAAIGLTKEIFPSVEAYIFCAGDGATDPCDLRPLAAAFEEGYDLVLGSRTRRIRNWRTMTVGHVIANAGLGLWAGLLGGRFFSDLSPMRVIRRSLFERMALEEMTFGWTIEAQIAAARLGATICEIPVRERRRIAGRQKVSGVSWRRTFAIGCQIFSAGWRARGKFRAAPEFPESDYARSNRRRHHQT